MINATSSTATRPSHTVPATTNGVNNSSDRLQRKVTFPQDTGSDVPPSSYKITTTPRRSYTVLATTNDSQNALGRPRCRALFASTIGNDVPRSGDKITATPRDSGKPTQVFNRSVPPNPITSGRPNAKPTGIRTHYQTSQTPRNPITKEGMGMSDDVSVLGIQVTRFPERKNPLTEGSSRQNPSRRRVSYSGGNETWGKDMGSVSQRSGIRVGYPRSESPIPTDVLSPSPRPPIDRFGRNAFGIFSPQ